MSEMRAKMKVSEVHSNGAGQGESLILRAVSKPDGYPLDGADENNSYAKFTPSAVLHIHINNPDLTGKFAEGDTFYVDFTRIPA